MTSTPRMRAVAAFEEMFGTTPEVLVRAPGRVNLIGEHVDYNDGFVLPMAIDRAVWVAASRCGGATSSLAAVDLSERVTLELASTRGAGVAALPVWARYPAGVGLALAERGLAPVAVNATIASDVPMGAGLSSSAALEVAFALLWRELGDHPLDDMDLARLCQQAEADTVGVRCGLMDQFTSVHGRIGHALLLDCRSLAWRPVRLPPDTVVVIADTRIRRELARSEFNTRRSECEQSVERLRTRLSGIRSLRDVSPADLAAHEDVLSELLARRARHVVSEIDRVERVIPAVDRGDAKALGQAMTAAHRSGRDLYEVSCAELDILVETAVALDGCHGARLTGAGFGGCTVSLVDADRVEEFSRRLGGVYQRETGIVPGLWTCRADDGAKVIRHASV